MQICTVLHCISFGNLMMQIEIFRNASNFIKNKIFSKSDNKNLMQTSCHPLYIHQITYGQKSPGHDDIIAIIFITLNSINKRKVRNLNFTQKYYTAHVIIYKKSSVAL